jgi:hypothetical protein
VRFTILSRLPLRKRSECECINLVDVVTIMERRTARNTANNVAPFMKTNYSCRSMCRLHKKLIVDSSATHCVPTANEKRHLTSVFTTLTFVKMELFCSLHAVASQMNWSPCGSQRNGVNTQDVPPPFLPTVRQVLASVTRVAGSIRQSIRIKTDVRW